MARCPRKRSTTASAASIWASSSVLISISVWYARVTDTASTNPRWRTLSPMADPNIANQNAPATAVGLVQAFMLVVAAFTTLTDVQITALNTFLSVAAAFIVQRFHTDPKTST